MLKSRTELTPTDPHVVAVMALISGGVKSEWIAEGIQSVGDFGSSDCYPDYEHYPVLGEVSEHDDMKFGDFSSHGVCDNYQQILDKCPEIVNDPDREFMITLTEIVKANEPEDGGWRWHKWGEYIGEHEIEHEYLYYEKDIESVFCYHVYEFKNEA